MKNYYDILEVSEKASSEVIEKAYKALAKKYHPDLQPDDKKQEAEAKIKLINEAYETLSDNIKKSNYDNQLKAQKIEAEKAKYGQINRQSNINSNINHTSNSNAAKNNSHANNTKRTVKPQHMQKNNLTDEQLINNATIKDAYNEAYQKAYQKAYIDNLKNMGYEIKYEKTFKEYLKTFLSVIFAIIVLLILCTILWHIPPIKNYLINLYNNNELIKLIVDFIYKFYLNIISLFK